MSPRRWRRSWRTFPHRLRQRGTLFGFVLWKRTRRRSRRGPSNELAEQVKNQIPRLFRAFRKEIKVLSSASDCSCHACSCIAALRLKQAVHVGEVAVEKIGRFEKLFGLAVIFVHRMLKNTVPASEYLMLSEPAFSNIDDFFSLEPERRVVELEGIGEHEMMVFYAEQLASLQDELEKTEGPIPPLSFSDTSSEPRPTGPDRFAVTHIWRSLVRRPPQPGPHTDVDGDVVLFQNSAERESVSWQGLVWPQPSHSRSTWRVLDPVLSKRL